MRRRTELMMIQRAINQGWDIPEDERRRSIQLITTVLNDPSATVREKLRAGKILIAMESANLVEDLNLPASSRYRPK